MREINQSVRKILVRRVVPVCIAYTLVGLSFGAICSTSGVPAWLPIVSSLTVFAGSAQFAAVGIALTGGSAFAAVLAGLVINARLAAYSFAVRQSLGTTRLRRLLCAHLITDVNTALALQEHNVEIRRKVFWQAGLIIFVVWNVSVALGELAGQLTVDPHAVGLDAVLPAVLFALIRPALDDYATCVACAGGCLVAAISLPLLPAGLPVVVSTTGLAVFLSAKLRRSLMPESSAEGEDRCG